MPSRPEVLLQSWSLPLGLTAALAVAAIVYLRGWLRLHKAFPRLVPISRLACFMSSLLAIWVAAGSPLGMLDHALLSAHMVQHLLLMAVAAPLLLVGAPCLAFLYGIPQIILRGVADRVRRCLWIGGLGRVLSHPATCLLAASLVLIGWHLPAAFQLGLRSDRWHEVEHASFFLTGIMLWWPVVRPWPSVPRWPEWYIPAYLFLATLPCDALAAFLTFYERVVYSWYRSAPAFLGRSPIADQQFAGALMWLCVTLIYMTPAVVITVQLLSPSSVKRGYPAIQTTNTPPADQSGI